MRRTLKGFLGLMAVIAIVAVAGGAVHAQVTIPPIPLAAEISPTAHAVMNLKINQQCIEQKSITGTATTGAFVAKKFNFNEKDVIDFLAAHASSCASGPFPTDLNKVKLFYQYDGIGNYAVKAGLDAKHADITVTCVTLGQFGVGGQAVYAGAENATATVNSAKVSIAVPWEIIINIPASATQDGLLAQLIGVVKENVNLPKLVKGKQVLTDTWTFSGGGPGQYRPKNGGTLQTLVCDGTASASGILKR